MKPAGTAFRAALRAGGRGAKVGTLALVLSSGACRAYDLPPVVASSAHFRYHAREAQDVPGGTLPWLEAHRADVLSALGALQSQDHRIVDYYLFRDAADRDQNSPCSAAVDCEQNGSVYSISATTEFELVHAYASGLGNPPRLIQEGIGGVYSWSATPHVDPVRPPDWTEAATDDGSKGDIQSGGYLLALYLLRTYGARRLADYYAWADKTEDPALLDLQFREFWGRSVGSVWQVMTGSPGISPRPSLVPVCPCNLSSLSNDGATVDAPYPGQLAYFPLDLPADGALAMTLASSTSTAADAFVQDCARGEASQAIVASASGGRSMGIVRLVPGSYFVGFGLSHGQQISSSAGSWLSSTCDGAAPVTLAADVDKISVLVPRLNGGAIWFLHLFLDSARQIALSSPVGPTSATVAACTNCAGAPCASLVGTGMPVSGDVMLQLTTGTAPAFTHQRVELTVR
jgi:hypothetical protein